MRELSDHAIEAHLEHARVPCVESATLLYPIDGACHRVPPGDTAFGYREATFSTVIGKHGRIQPTTNGTSDGSAIIMMLFATTQKRAAT